MTVLNMKYSQYKKSYSDCKTVAGTYNKGSKTIDVMIPDGRLKNSGVRGKHFSGYEFKNSKNEFVCFRAVDEEHARKQAEKEFPENEWILSHIYY